MARALIVFGVLLLVAGFALLLLERLPGVRPGKLPGDITIQKGNWRFYFPLATSLLLSLLLSALFSLLFWLLTRR